MLKMKNTICFLLMVGLSSIGLGQTVETTTLPDKSYGEGGTKTVTTTTNKHGEKTTVTEIRGPGPDKKVRDRNHRTEDLNGNITINDTNFTNQGNVFKTVHQEFDSKKILVNSQTNEFKGGNVIYTHTRTKKDDGSYDVHEDDKEKGTTSDKNEPAGSTTNIRPPDDFKHPEQKVGCLPKFELYAGYSYLSAKIGDKMEGYSLGAEISATYVLNNKWGVQLDGSWHSKSKDDFKYSQSYVFAGMQYDFKKEEQCLKDAQWRAVARFLVGGSFFSESYDIMGYGSD
jgi:hypothetical protein